MLLKLEKGVIEPTQRKVSFKMVCKDQGKCCKAMIDSGSTDNVVSTEVVEKLKLKKKKHPTPYKVSWLQKGHQLLVNEKSELELYRGRYKDKILCDIMPMDAFHILLDRLWQFDIGVVHDGKNNIYKFYKDGINYTLLPLQEEGTSKNNDCKAFLLSNKECLQQMEDNKVSFSLVCKPKVIIISTIVNDFPFEIQYMLNKYSDIVVDDLPNDLKHVSISHHIDLMLGSSLPNKATYKMTPHENEEIKKASVGTIRYRNH